MNAEIDVRVATEVMGWPTGPEAHAVNWVSTASPVCWKDGVLWSPSTDMRAAWDVVEEMRGRGYKPSLHECSHANEGWRVVFDVAAYPVGAAIAATPTDAICLAALDAMTVERENAR